MEQLVALWSILDELVSLHCLDKVVGVQQGQADMVQQVLQHGPPVLHIVVHPPHHRLKHHLLLSNGQIITADVFFQLVPVQVKELLVLCHLREVGKGIAAAATGQLLEGMCIGKALDAKAVARVQLVLQEFCTSIAQCGDLEEAGSLEEELDILSGDPDATGVNKTEERVHRLGQDAVDLHQHLAALAVIIAEHSSEVGGAGGEHSAVAGELPALHADDHIGEETTVTELIENLEDGLRVRGARGEVQDILAG